MFYLGKATAGGLKIILVSIECGISHKDGAVSSDKPFHNSTGHGWKESNRGPPSLLQILHYLQSWRATSPQVQSWNRNCSANNSSSGTYIPWANSRALPHPVSPVFIYFLPSPPFVSPIYFDFLFLLASFLFHFHSFTTTTNDPLSRSIFTLIYLKRPRSFRTSRVSLLSSVTLYPRIQRTVYT